MTGEEFKILELISKMSMDKASQVFSKTIKAGSRIEIARLRKVDITQISEELEGEDKEVSGAIVQLTGDTPTKLLFMINLDGALTLTDLYLRRNIGETKDFDIFVESTIQEIGNILASSIANVFVKDFNIELSPEPPLVINDYSSSIFNTLLMEEAYSGNDEIILVETKFFIVKMSIDCNLILLPSFDSTKLL
ncbi:chemotaxis protein CheC, partial [Thermodesulfobacteriota bacterium]